MSGVHAGDDRGERKTAVVKSQYQVSAFFAQKLDISGRSRKQTL
jgi:hypothetical protein